jgi:hypothetical protein
MHFVYVVIMVIRHLIVFSTSRSVTPLHISSCCGANDCNLKLEHRIAAFQLWKLWHSRPVFSSRKSVAVTDHLVKSGSQDGSIVTVVTRLWAG